MANTVSEVFVDSFIAAHLSDDPVAIGSHYHPEAIWNFDAGTVKPETIPNELFLIGQRFHVRRVLEERIISNDRFCIRWTESAFKLDSPAPGPDTRPSHQSIVNMILRVERDKIIEHWVARDLTYYLKALGW
jgi:hypothetical protein